MFIEEYCYTPFDVSTEAPNLESTFGHPLILVFANGNAQQSQQVSAMIVHAVVGHKNEIFKLELLLRFFLGKRVHDWFPLALNSGRIQMQSSSMTH